MTRETKVGLLVGMGVILLIGIIVSDHLAIMNQDQQAAPTDFADRAQGSIHSDRIGDAHTASRYDAPPRRPLPTSDELDALRNQPTPRPNAPANPTAQQRNYQAYSLDGNGYASRDRDTGAASTPPPAEQSQPPQVQSTESNQSTRFAGSSEPADSRDEAPDEASEVRTVTISRADEDRGSSNGGGDSDVIMHEVESDESLYAIARHYYGNGNYWRVLKEHNPDKVGAEGQVRVGVKLVVPNRAHLANTESDARDLERRANEALRGGDDSNSGSDSARQTITAGPGDTLSTLAAEYLGSARQWRELLEANRDKLETATDLQAGMTLRLPTGAERAAPSDRENDRDHEQRQPDRYKVKPGDSLVEIAERLLGSGDRWRELYKVNQQKIENPDVLPVGVELRIPS